MKTTKSIFFATLAVLIMASVITSCSAGKKIASDQNNSVILTLSEVQRMEDRILTKQLYSTGSVLVLSRENIIKKDTIIDEEYVNEFRVLDTLIINLRTPGIVSGMSAGYEELLIIFSEDSTKKLPFSPDVNQEYSISSDAGKITCGELEWDIVSGAENFKVCFDKLKTISNTTTMEGVKISAPVEIKEE